MPDAKWVTRVELPKITVKMAEERTGMKRLPTRHYGAYEIAGLATEHAGPGFDGAAREIHDLDAGNGRLGRVVLQRVGALGGVAEVHQTSPTSLRSPSMKVNERGLVWVR